MLCPGLGCFPLGTGRTTKGPTYVRGVIDDVEKASNRGHLFFSDLCECRRAQLHIGDRVQRLEKLYQLTKFTEDNFSLLWNLKTK